MLFVPYISLNGRVRGKVTDVCNDASGILNERPKFLAMSCTVALRYIPSLHTFLYASTQYWN